MSATGVKQFYTEADTTLRTYTGSSTVVSGVCYLKGVTINPSGTSCHVRIYSGSSATATNKIYEQKLKLEIYVYYSSKFIHKSQ